MFTVPSGLSFFSAFAMVRFSEQSCNPAYLTNRSAAFVDQSATTAARPQLPIVEGKRRAPVRGPRTRLADAAPGLPAGSRRHATGVAAAGRTGAARGHSGGTELPAPTAVPRLRGAAVGRPRERAAVGCGDVR